jgi:glycosyltransferase involved in cell wall biosynthesis
VRADRPVVRFLVGTADGRNGVVRSVLNTAGWLASDYDVQVIGLFRRRPAPVYAIPPGVRLRFLEDLSEDRVRSGPLRLRLSKLDSRVIETPNSAHLQGSSLLTDILLVKALQTMRSGVLVTTRSELHAVAARFAPRGLALIAHEHMHYFQRVERVRRRVDRHIDRFGAMVTLTERDRSDYIQRSSWPPAKVHVIPNAARGAILTDVRPRKKIIVAAGRLTEQKGYDRLIEAFSPVAVAHPEWELRIYGRGPDRRKLQRMINERGIAAQAHLMGWTDQLDAILSEAAIFALSSRFEGLPLVGIEAMSKGLPIVAFDCPRGPRELVRDGVNGYLVANGEVPAFTQALGRLVADAQLREVMGKASLVDARQYEMSTVGEQWEQLIAGLLSSSSRSRQTVAHRIRSRSVGAE